MNQFVNNILSMFNKPSNAPAFVTSPEYSSLNSPYSLSNILLPILYALSDETLDQFAQSLGISNLSHYVRDIQNNNEKINSNCLESVTIVLSRDDIVLNNQYLKLISNIATHSYFSQENISEVISKVNNTVNDSTHGMINSILNDNDIDHATFAVFLNTIYFKLNWHKKFDPYFTENKTFHNKLLGNRDEYFMNLHTIRVKYLELDLDRIVLLQYENPDFMFCIVLPTSENFDPPQHNLLCRESDFVNSVVNNGIYQHINLTLPKFTKEIELDLIPFFKNNGMTKLFDNTMQIRGMVDPQPDNISMSVIRQKVKIEITEDGTTASGASVAVMMLESCCLREPIKCIDFNCNHPFTYYIFHNPTRTILFSGIYE